MNAGFIATSIATAFTIIDPIGMIPLTLAATASVPPQSRGRTIDQAVIVAAIVIAVMGLLGRAILHYLGITLPAFMIAGFAAALAATWACMRAAAAIVGRIGSTGIHVVTRLLGIILAALAVQFVLNGLVATPLFAR
ncbi:MAG TPA: MarC family protein [Candidatus Baltobacteraceae bacterium]|jgi:small neutral amino acid transporter SnatA (MarC family)